MSRACRTSSPAAMQVITRCMPLKFEIIKKAVLTRVKWMKTTNWTTYQFNPEEDPPEEYLKREKEKLEAIFTTIGKRTGTRMNMEE